MASTKARREQRPTINRTEPGGRIGTGSHGGSSRRGTGGDGTGSQAREPAGPGQAPAASRAPVAPAASGRRTYVLDTSVLLADPAAIGRFAEHQVVLPIVVITELEAKRHHPELGYFARQALRLPG